MKVVVLCGGQGTRLGEVTQGLIPKPLVQIGGRPILWHIMKSYYKFDYNDFVICSGYMGDKIAEYFLNYKLHNSDFRVNTLTGEMEYLDDGNLEEWSVLLADTGLKTMTAGRLSRVLKHLNDDEPFFLTYGDGLSDVNIPDLLAFHKKHGKLATICGVVPPGRFGELRLDGSQIVEMSEKPAQSDRYINGGFMVLEPEFVRRYCDVPNTDNIMLEREPLETAADDGELMMYEHKGFWQCMDTMRDWQLLNTMIEKGDVPWA